MTIIFDGKECEPHSLPDGPLYIVWGPQGETPVRYVFSRLGWAENAAAKMAEHHKDAAQVFYVATLLSWHQHQTHPVKGNQKLGDLFLENFLKVRI